VALEECEHGPGDVCERVDSLNESHARGMPVPETRAFLEGKKALQRRVGRGSSAGGRIRTGRGRSRTHGTCRTNI
jgi:hypothetical protein